MPTGRPATHPHSDTTWTHPGDDKSSMSISGNLKQTLLKPIKTLLKPIRTLLKTLLKPY